MKKDIWHQLEVKTGKQKMLWVMAIAISVIFSNNLVDFFNNLFNNPPLAGFLYAVSFFVFRIILGKLFD